MTRTFSTSSNSPNCFRSAEHVGPWTALRRRFAGGAEKLPKVHAVDDVSFVINKGETVGLVGKSGCGKSTLVRALTRLIDASDGSMKLGARELSLTPAREFARDPDRARIQMVFQDAGDSVNPRFTAFDAIADPLRRLRKLRGEALDKKGRSGGEPMRIAAATAATASRISYRAASAPASASPALSPSSRICWCSMSRRRRSTFRFRWSFFSSCSG